MFVVALLAAAALTSEAGPHDVYGLWETEGGRSIVEISDCGNNTPCGNLVWINPANAQDNGNRNGGIDRNNPDPSLRERPILGITLLDEFERAGDGWRRGRIYDPRRGKFFRSTIRLSDDGTLSVKGCVALFCGGQQWTRVSAIPAS